MTPAPPHSQDETPMPDQRAATFHQQVRGRPVLYGFLSLAGPAGTVGQWLPGGWSGLFSVSRIDNLIIGCSGPGLLRTGLTSQRATGRCGHIPSTPRWSSMIMRCALSTPGDRLNIAKEIGETDAQPQCNYFQNRKRDRCAAAFDVTDIAPVDSKLSRHVRLGQCVLLSQLSQPSTEAAANIICRSRFHSVGSRETFAPIATWLR